MRRPVKPFVTEYKGPSRRPSPPSAPIPRRSIEDHPNTSLVHDGLSRGGLDHSHHPEDSYEAALRAADALFAPNLNKPLALASSPEEAAADGAAQFDAGAGGTPRGGRILRVLDEPPLLLPGLADEDDERAPKRRGRKPGSKNKPKAGVFAPPEMSAAQTPPAPFEWTSPSPAARPEPPARKAPAPRTAAAAPRENPVPAVAASQGQRVIAPVSGYAARNETRFSWVRTKLAPGEQWKRRLPKVCW